MRLETKTVRATITEAKADGNVGTATALVSVFGNVDMGGDRVLPGAFTATLDAWRAKGDPIPVIWSHDWDNPESFVGAADPAAIKETADGLVVPMVFDLERPRAEQVHHLLKERRVTQFSFGYFAKDYDMVDDEEYGKVRELRSVELFEVGPTLLGMNPATQLLEAASALRHGAKAGRVLSSKNEERIRAAHQALTDVLAALPAPDDGKAAKAAPQAKVVDVPSYVAENAARGLRYLEEGYGGDGLVDATIRDARQMADGTVSDAKVRRIGPWIARHLVDLDAPQNSNPDHEDYPGPGLVAMLLWGGGPDKEGALRTQEWAEAAAAELDEKARRRRRRYGKATPEEAVEGAFATWPDEDGGDYLGRIEHVMTEGVLGVDGSEYRLEATPEDPAILLRLFQQDEDGWEETELLMGARASQVTVVPAPDTAPAEDAPEGASTTPDTPATDAGDRAGTINTERVAQLLARPRHQED